MAAETPVPCCGMAGSFGLEAEHRAASQAMAELSLLPTLRAAPPEVRLIANGLSCRHQIVHGSDRAPKHIALVRAKPWMQTIKLAKMPIMQSLQLINRADTVVALHLGA